MIMTRKDVFPTSERLRHSWIERGGQISDSAGNIGDPHQVVSTLTIMLRRHTITPEMYQAGDQFHIEFQVAHLEPLKAADFAQTRVSGRQLSGLPRKIAEARDSIWRAVKLMGGLSSPCGSIAWEVIGRGGTLEEWGHAEVVMRRGKPLRRQVAAGVLLGALGVLVMHYGLEKQVNLV